ncbi:Snf7-domain-containing protein [Xylariaceae sp. FL0016]|nr:Snf7-domain-containing protein [Xylariaceae sp. FL0016]
MSELLSYLVENDPNFRRARLPALYSDFRSQQTLNPDGYIANVNAWKRGLSNAALAGHAPSKSPLRNHLTVELDDSLLRSLESKQFGRPLALGSALQEALASGEMMPLQQFLKATQSIHYKSCGSIPLSVLGWGLRKIGVSGPGDSMPKGQFVVLSNLEALTKTFVDAIADRSSPFERTFSNTHFRKTFEGSLLGGQKLSDSDFEVLTKYLTRDKGILATDGTKIKILDSTSNTSISQEDSAIASLKELIEDMTHQVDVLTSRIDTLTAQAQSFVQRKNLASARAALKSKKLAESTLATRHATLIQLEEVATKIQQAADNVALVNVMKSSTAALRSLNGQIGGADEVDTVLDGLREQMSEVDEVGNIIAETARPVDETEVEDEFEALLADERKKEEEVERVRKEAQDAKEAEETRRKLAELDRLQPVPQGQTETAQKEAEKENSEVRPLTPVTAAANVLDKMHIDTEKTEESQAEKPEQIPAQ